MAAPRFTRVSKYVAGDCSTRETASLTATHFAIGGDYGSTVNVVNTGQLATTLTLSAFDERQRPVGQTAKITVEAGAAMRASVNELFHIAMIQTFPPLISGFIRIDVSPPSQRSAMPASIVGTVEIYLQSEGAKRASMLYAMSDTPSTRWIIPFLRTTGGYFTGFTFISSEKANVKIGMVDADGSQVGGGNVISTGPLRFALLLPAGYPNGYLRFESDTPIYVLGTIGTIDGSVLDQVPAIRQ